MKRILLGLLALVALVFFLYKEAPKISHQLPGSQPPPSATTQPSPTFGQRTKTSGCISLNELPDKGCTPGDIDPKVTKDNIQSTICVSGYTKTVRPPVSYTNDLKIKQIQEYGYSDTNPKDYEEDHLISLELGGSPTSEANLWPEPYNTTLNAKEKDKVENYLHDQVCSGKITLLQARLQIANDWISVYKQIQH